MPDFSVYEIDIELIRTTLERIGTILAPYLDFLPEVEPLVIGIVVSLLSIALLTTVVIWIIGLARRLTHVWRKARADKRSINQLKLERLNNDLQLEQAQFVLKQQRLQHKAELQRIKSDRRFSKVSTLVNTSDALHALWATLAPVDSIESELSGFKTRVHLSGNSSIGQFEASLKELEEIAKEGPTKLRHNNSTFVAQIDEHIQKIEENIREAKALLEGELATGDAEEERARADVEAWETRLGRTAYVSSFKSFFEENVNKWISSQPWKGSSKRADTAAENASDSQGQSPTSTDDADGLGTSIKRAARQVFGGFGNFWAYFAGGAIIPEFVYSYPAFEAIADGDQWATVAGTAVFTIGLLTMGQMTGIAFQRARRWEGPIESSQARWRFSMALCALLFTIFGSFMVYTGATLRGTTGTLVRLASEVHKAERDQKSSAEVAALQQKKEEILKHPTPAYQSIEGWCALAVYGVFFLTSIMSRIYGADPVFEFGLAFERLILLRRIRYARSLVVGSYLSLASAQLLAAKNEKIALDRQQFEDSGVAQRAAMAFQVGKLKEQSKAYYAARLRFFGNLISKIRRKSAKRISTWLDRECA